MAHHSGEQHLQRLSELDDYRIEPGDTDPRGWTVIAPDGSPIGVIEDLIVDTNQDKVRYFAVRPNDSGRASGRTESIVFVDAITADLESGERRVRAAGLVDGSQLGTAFVSDYDTTRERRTDEQWTAGTEAAAATTGRGDETARLTRAEEELRIGKREVTRGEVRVGKRVETEHVREPATRRREEAYVERRPVAAGERGDASIGTDEVRIPLTEEELVVDKRPVVKEELVVGKRVVEEREVVEADLRKERFEGAEDVERNRGKRER